MSANTNLKVHTNLLPFHLYNETVEVPYGLSIEEMVRRVIPIRGEQVDITVTINGEEIPIILWGNVRPKVKALIGLHVVPAKGKGGKNPLAMILSVALMVAAPYIAGAVTAGFAGGVSLAGAQAIYGAVRIGLGLVGFLASSMLSSTPKQDRNQREANLAESPTQFIEGASNQILKYGVIPICLGTNRMFPPQAALPFTETIGNDQYVYQLFTTGYGKVVITDRKIGETAIEKFQGVSMSDRLNADLDLGTQFYINDTYQEGMNVLLSSADGWTTRTTQRDTNEASFDVTFFRGLTGYDQRGTRYTEYVGFDYQYAPTGTDDWSSGIDGKEFAYDQSITVPIPYRTELQSYNPYPNTTAQQSSTLFINIKNGTLEIVQNNRYDTSQPSFVPADSVRLASFTAEAPTPSYPSGRIISFSDDRAANTPKYFADSSSFVPTYLGMTINVSEGTFSPQPYYVGAATAEALRVTIPFKFPTPGQYDVRIRRTTPDFVADTQRGDATLTGLRSVSYRKPVRQKNISGIGMKILGSDQLNGSVDRFNMVVSSVCLDFATGEWEEAVTDNPAALYRYVLQSPAFAKRLADARIDIAKLEEWYVYCKLKKLTYNRVIDYEASIEDVLRDIAAAGMATPHNVSGKYSIIIDNERPDIEGMVTPHNSWGYSGNMNYPDMPHALRVRFRNSDKGFELDERIVYADGYDEDTAELYESLEFLSCTNADLAWFYGRMYFATAELQRETHKWSMDFENLDFNRGSRITLVHDAILVGVGSGRIKSFIYDNPSSPTEIIGFVLNDTVDIPNANGFGVRIRNADATGYVYHSLNTIIGYTQTFTFTTPIPVEDSPGIGSLCSFTEMGKELDLIVIDINTNYDMSAKITAVNYAPERFDAANGAIPAFSSNITIPTDLLPPQAPRLSAPIQSDESVMTRNSDGSFTSRMVISLLNRNEPSVVASVKVRPVGASQFVPANYLLSSPTQIVLTGLEDGFAYDLEIRYQRQTGRRLFSDPLVLNNVVFTGATGIPGDVTNFTVQAAGDVGMFKYTGPSDVDIDHFIMKHTKLTSGAIWTNMQILDDDIEGTRADFPLQTGTYMVKAVDILGNESANAAVIIVTDAGALKNVVEFYQEQTAWAGTKTNTHVISGDLYLIDPTVVGYYEFGDTDLGDIYTSTLTSALVAYGANYLRLRTVDHIRSLSSLRSTGLNSVRSLASIRSVTSMRGINPSDWQVELQMALSQDGTTFADWQPFTVGNHVFRRVKFRLKLESFNENVNARIDRLEVTVDMPDRQEWGEDVTVPNTGLTVAYSEKFMNNPSVNITIQNGAVDDRLEYTAKDNEGFTIKIYNGTLASYIERVVDYQSTGYGRIIS